MVVLMADSSVAPRAALKANCSAESLVGAMAASKD